MNAPDLNELLAKQVDHGRRPIDVQIARNSEKRYRTSKAATRAVMALRRLYSDDYRSLYAQALAQVDAERGVLPGDEVVS